MIRLRTLGPPEVRLDGESAPPELRWRKNLALLVYLARSPRRARTREHLRGLLWGEKPEPAARHSLNEALRVIRRHAGEELVRSAGRQVVLDDARVELDADRLVECLERQAWDEAAGLVGGIFLEGFGVADASPFEDWLAAERVLWTRHSLRALAAHAESRLDRGDLIGGQEVAGRAVALDPYSDAATRAMMRAAALAGERAVALDLYAEFAGRLKRELGASPAPDTVRLADRIRLERAWRLPEALKAPTHTLRRTPLIGREQELALALDLWGKSRRTGSGALLVVEGEAGVGKTRLVEEIAARARLDGGTISAIRAVPSDLQVPWSGVLGLCRGGLLEAPGLLAAPTGALAAVAAELPEWAERFADETREAEPPPMARAFVELLRPSAEEQPLLLCVDDADWLDAESAEALDRALRDLENLPFLLVLAVAQDPPHGLLDRLRARAGRDLPGAVMPLRPLERTALRRLAGEAFPEYAPEALDRLARRLEADSAGLPLLAVELLHAVRLGVELEDRGEGWPAPHVTLDQTLPGDLPGAVVAAIRVGFRRVSPDAQKVLAAAAVLEERVDAAALERATELSSSRVAEALDELEWGRWLASDPRGYTFVARIVRRVIAEDMVTPGHRRRLADAARS